MTGQQKYDIVVVGAGPAGLTSALYALRSGRSVMILEKETFGGQITHSPKIENYPGLPAVSGSEFAEKLMDQVLVLGAELEVDEVVSVIDRGERKEIRTVRAVYDAGAVIVAAGSRHRLLNVPGEKELVGRGVSYCVLCDGAFYADKHTAVIGGGNSALQEAVLLSETCDKVTLIQNLDRLTGEARLVDLLKQRKNVEFLFHTVVTSLESRDGKLCALKLRDTRNDRDSTFAVDGVFIAIGQVPENNPFRMVGELDDRGYLVAGEDCLTRTPGVFAAGDCRSKKVRQITTATGDGASAALAACRYLETGVAAAGEGI